MLRTYREPLCCPQCALMKHKRSPLMQMRSDDMSAGSLTLCPLVTSGSWLTGDRERKDKQLVSDDNGNNTSTDPFSRF